MWVVYSVAAFSLWGVWGFLAKLSTDAIPAKSAVVMQGAGGLAVTLILVALLRGASLPSLAGSLYGALAGAALFAGLIAFAFALSNGGKASIVVTMTALYPVVTIALGILVLREQIILIQAVGAALALVAVFLMTRG